MSVDTTSYYDSLLLSSSSASSVAVTTDAEASSLDSNDFLTLLVTELQCQDPTEPMDNTEMVNQLTQYSQLDELTDLNEKLDTLTESLTSMTTTSGLEYLGKQVEAAGYTVAKDGDDVSTLYYNLADDAESLTFNIYDSSGSIVDTLTYSQMDSGVSAFVWDGTDSDGNAASDGYYYISAKAEDSDGSSIDVSTSTTGTVAGVSNSDDGVILTLEDGRTVNMLNVTYATI